jgi:hypothetical protein
MPPPYNAPVSAIIFLIRRHHSLASVGGARFAEALRGGAGGGFVVGG